MGRGDEQAVEFDIPSQLLASALDAYSTATGRELFYDGALAVGRRSSEVKGRLTPEVALRRLLRGTGYVARSTGPNAFTVEPAARRVPPGAVIPGGAGKPAGRFDSYFALVQARVGRALCSTPETRPGAYRLLVRLWITPAGAVSRSELMGTTGETRRDLAYGNVLRNLGIGRPPPEGMPQPITLAVMPAGTAAAGGCAP